MKTRELVRKHQSLRALFAKIDVVAGPDMELRAQWARYMCVLSAGFLEGAIADIYTSLVLSSSSPVVANYASKQLSSIQNPKTKRFLEVAGAFRPEWRDQLQAFVSEGGRQEAIDSIMSNRHLIAHGRFSGITMARVTEYLDKAIEVLEFIEAQCGL